MRIPTMHDRAMQALYLLALDPIAETLGGAGRSGVASVRRLKVLRARLSTSRLVGRLIVRELARLDRRLGPSVGQNP